MCGLIFSCYDSGMTFSMLGISIGNTRTQVGTFVAGELDSPRSVGNEDVKALEEAIVEGFAPIKDDEDVTVLIASVEAEVCEKVESFVKRSLGISALRVERDVEIPIGRQLDPEAIVGEDRLLNAAAAYATLEQAVIVVDAGTAVTVDLVDADGTFHGGAIGPGVGLQLASLHEHTNQLPETTMAKPKEPVGHSTAEAIRCGVYYGIRGMVRELVEQYAVRLGAFPIVIATGGDALLLFEDDELIDRIVPHLTLAGLGVTVRKARD